MAITKENYKDLPWGEMTVDDEYLDFLKTLGNDETVEFLKFLLEHHPDFDEQWAQLYFNVADNWKTNGEWDKLCAFTDFVRAKSPEAYKNEFYHIDEDPVLYALFQEDLDLVKLRFAESVRQPAEAIDSTLKVVFNLLSTDRKYTEYTKEVAEQVWQPLENAERLMGGAEFNYASFLYCTILETTFDKIQKGEQVDWQAFTIEVEAVNFKYVEEFSQLPTINFEIEDAVQFHQNEAYREKHYTKILVPFLYYAHTEAGIPIYWAFRGWFNILKYLLGQEEASKRKNWFTFTPKMIDKMGGDLKGFLGGNTTEMVITFKVLPYLYDFFLKQQYIDERTYTRLLEYYEYSKRRVIDIIGRESWQYKGLYTWKRPNSLSEEKEAQEKALMLDSINWTYEEARENIRNYLSSLPKLPDYVKPPPALSLFERMMKSDVYAAESPAVSPKIGRSRPKRTKKRKKKHKDNRKRGAKKNKRK